MDAIRFKNDADKRAWPAHADPRLVEVVELLARIATGHGVPMPLTITSFLRPAPRTSVHAWGRGADIRTRDWPADVAQRLADEMNARLVYDPARPAFLVAVNEPDAALGEHLHLQVPPPGKGPVARPSPDAIA
jgi:hypothetical protein